MTGRDWETVPFQESAERLSAILGQLEEITEQRIAAIPRGHQPPKDFNSILGFKMRWKGEFSVYAHHHSELYEETKYSSVSFMVDRDNPSRWVVTRWVLYYRTNYGFSLDEEFISSFENAENVYDFLLKRLDECRQEYVIPAFERLMERLSYGSSDFRLAACSALHPRLGKMSPLASLPEDIFRQILMKDYNGRQYPS